MLLELEYIVKQYYDPFDRVVSWQISIPENVELESKLRKFSRRSLYDADVVVCRNIERSLNQYYADKLNDYLRLRCRVPIKYGDIIDSVKPFIIGVDLSVCEIFDSCGKPVYLEIWKPTKFCNLLPANYWGVFHNRVAFDHRPYKTEILTNLTYDKVAMSMKTCFKIGRQICHIKTKTQLADIEAYVRSFRKMISDDVAPLYYSINKNEKWIIYTDLF